MYACLVRVVKHFVVLRLVRQLFCILVIVDGGGVFGGLFQLCENTLETQKKISKEHTLAFK